MTHKKADWYRIIDIDIAEDLSIECPRCGNPYYIGPLPDKEFRKCLNCETQLVEWNIIRFVYLVDIEKAPKVVQHLTHYLRSLNADEAYNELVLLHEFLGNPLYD